MGGLAQPRAAALNFDVPRRRTIDSTRSPYFPGAVFTITRHVLARRVEEFPVCGPKSRDGRNQNGSVYPPVSNVSRASCGSHCCQSAASCEKLTPRSSCPSAGNTNCSLNVRDNRSVKFRKHCRRSSALMLAVRVSASLQQVVTTSLALVTYDQSAPRITTIPR